MYFSFRSFLASVSGTLLFYILKIGIPPLFSKSYYRIHTISLIFYSLLLVNLTWRMCNRSSLYHFNKPVCRWQVRLNTLTELAKRISDWWIESPNLYSLNFECSTLILYNFVNQVLRLLPTNSYYSKFGGTGNTLGHHLRISIQNWCRSFVSALLITFLFLLWILDAVLHLRISVLTQGHFVDVDLNC